MHWQKAEFSVSAKYTHTGWGAGTQAAASVPTDCVPSAVAGSRSCQFILKLNMYQVVQFVGIPKEGSQKNPKAIQMAGDQGSSQSRDKVSQAIGPVEAELLH